MTALLAIQLLALLLLLAASAFSSSAETTFFSLNPHQVQRLRRQRPQAAERVERILALPNHLLSTILIANTIVNVAASAIGYAIAEHFWPGHGERIAIPVMTLILVVFGEVTPKRHAVAHADRLAALYATLVTWEIRALAPLRGVLEWIVRRFSRNLRPPNRALTEDELLSAVDVGAEEGVINAEERTMVDGIVGLEDLQASQVMTPRVELIGIDLDDAPEAWLKTAMRVQFRYLPVYRGSIDRPEGFLDVTRLLLSETHDFQSARIEPLFVPETARLDVVLATFQKEHRRVAFVADEYGGTAGLITLGDVLEEIIGDVASELEREKLTIQKMGENLWIVDGNTSLDTINDELGTHLRAENVDRISGWIAVHLGHMARTGETLELQGCRVTVHRTRQTRIVTVFIERLPPSVLPEQDSEQEGAP